VQPSSGQQNDQTFDFQINSRATKTRLTISLQLDTDLTSLPTLKPTQGYKNFPTAHFKK
jgi:hypothetical protein